MVFSKTKIKEKIDEFFSRENFTSDEVRKIKNIAMAHRIRLGKHRKIFCKHCLNKLEGKIVLNNNFKTIICKICKKSNRYKIK